LQQIPLDETASHETGVLRALTLGAIGKLMRASEGARWRNFPFDLLNADQEAWRVEWAAISVWQGCGRLDMNQTADSLIAGFDHALRTVTGAARASRANPGLRAEDAVLSPQEQRHSAGLMRVNHVGEVCAQALYDAQGRFAHTAALRRQFALAGQEEEDHLAWTAERLRELNSRPSLLNPLWYGGAYLLGVVAAKLGDAKSLGFVVETERQVEAHLAGHLEQLPAQDGRSRAIVTQMAADEVAHGAAAGALGAEELPAPVKQAMRAAAKVMTSVAYYL